jgi:hypothetical protein
MARRGLSADSRPARYILNFSPGLLATRIQVERISEERSFTQLPARNEVIQNSGSELLRAMADPNWELSHVISRFNQTNDGKVLKCARPPYMSESSQGHYVFKRPEDSKKE